MERTRVGEAIRARDAVVQRLSDAYISIRQKNSTIERLEHEQECLRKLNMLSIGGEEDTGSAGHETRKLKDEVLRLEGVIKVLEGEIKVLKSAGIGVKPSSDPPPGYEADPSKVTAYWT